MMDGKTKNKDSERVSDFFRDAANKIKEEEDIKWRKKLRENPLPSKLASEDNKARQDREMKDALLKGAKALIPGGAAGLVAEEVVKRQNMKSGGNVKAYKKGGKIDGCAQRGKTKGRMV
jgi:hypothetical protein